MNQIKIKEIYRDICRGYSIGSFKKKQFFFKHLNPIDYIHVEQTFQERMKEAEELGMLKFQDRLEEIIGSGFWDQSEENKIKEIQKRIDQVELGKMRAINFDAIQESNKLIKEYQEEIYQIELRRAALIGQTAEWFANNASVDKRIEISFFIDSSFETPLFSSEEIEYMDKDDAELATDLLNKFDESFSSQNLRFLSVQPFFQNVFSFADPISFFGRKGYELTNYQINLSSYAEYFKKLLKDCAGLDYESRCDPDKVEAFIIEKNNKLDDPQKGDADDPLMKMKKFEIEGEIPEN